jgi:hypothetical protein
VSARLAALAAGAVLASPYPPSLDPPTLTAWLRQADDIAPEQVIAVSPSVVTAILDRIPPTRGRAEVRLRALALTPQSVGRAGVAAWEMQLQVECRTGDVRLGATTGYPKRESRDQGVTLSPGDDAWRKPSPGTVLESAWRAVCDPKFLPPLVDGTQRIAQAPAKASPPARAAGPRPAARPAGPAPVAGRNAKGPAVPAPARGAKGAVQVVSSPDEAETRATLKRLHKRFGLTGYQTRVEAAKIGGRTTYRGVITGFASRSDALGFCRTLQKRGVDCLAR